MPQRYPSVGLTVQLRTHSSVAARDTQDMRRRGPVRPTGWLAGIDREKAAQLDWRIDIEADIGENELAAAVERHTQRSHCDQEAGDPRRTDGRTDGGAGNHCGPRRD